LGEIMRAMLRARAAFLDRQAAFGLYYSGNIWGDDESVSGPGSRRTSGSVLLPVVAGFGPLTSKSGFVEYRPRKSPRL
jgi:hypothetical protein